MMTDQGLITKFNAAVALLPIDVDQVTAISDGLYKVATQEHNQELMALVLMLRGNLRFVKGAYRDASNDYHQCQKLLPYIKNTYYKGYYYKSVADVYLKNDDYVLSLSNYHKALEAILGREDRFNIAQKVNGNIGFIYMEIDVYDKAYHYYEKVIELAEETGDEKFLSITYSKIGYCMLKTNQRREAYNYIQLGREFADKYKSPFDQAYSKYIFGQLYGMTKDYGKAQQVLSEALVYYTSEGNAFWQGRVMADKGKVFLNEGAYVEAEDILLRCQVLIMDKGYRSVELMVVGLLAKLYEAKELYKKSIHYYKHYTELKEALDRYWKSIQIEALVTKNNIDEEHLAIKELEHDKKILQSLSTVGRHMSASLEFNSIVDSIRDNIFDLTSGDLLIISIKQGNQIKYKVFGHNYKDEGRVHCDDQGSPIARFMQHNEITILEQLKDKQPIATLKRLEDEHMKGLNSLMITPLLNQSQHVGTIIVGRYGDVSFIKRDKELVGLLSTYVSVAIQNWIQADELNKRNAQLKELTEKDGLTGSYNRYALAQHMEQFINCKGKISVVMIDIDYFKEYNDAYGHQAGDQVLKTIAGVIRSRIIGFDGKAYRYGGDEFMLIVSKRTQEDIKELCEGIRTGVVRQHITHKTSKVSNDVTLTIGAVTSIRGCQKLDDLIGMADKALYKAKGQGRNNTQQMTIE